VRGVGGGFGATGVLGAAAGVCASWGLGQVELGARRVLKAPVYPFAYSACNDDTPPTAPVPHAAQVHAATTAQASSATQRPWPPPCCRGWEALARMSARARRARCSFGGHNKAIVWCAVLKHCCGTSFATLARRGKYHSQHQPNNATRSSRTPHCSRGAPLAPHWRLPAVEQFPACGGSRVQSLFSSASPDLRLSGTCAPAHRCTHAGRFALY
jgi:hypothetical protein